MTWAELNQQLNELQASLKNWQAKRFEALELARQAQEQAAAAQRQLDIHQGHIERIGIWLERAQAGQAGGGGGAIDIGSSEA